jgi:TIR domain
MRPSRPADAYHVLDMMEHDAYQGFDILVQPSARVHPTVAVCWFNVGRGKEEEFRLEMRVSDRYAFTNRTVKSTEDAQEIAKILGLRWVHGVIDLGRYQRGQPYTEERQANWKPDFGEASSDDDLEFELLGALRRMSRAEQNTSTILSLDIPGLADVLGVDIRRIREVLGEMRLAGTIEGYVETFGHTLTEGACRLTREGFQKLQLLEKSRPMRVERPDAPATPATSTDTANTTTPPTSAGNVRQSVEEPPRLTSPAFDKGVQNGAAPAEVLISYSHRDEKLRQALETHLSLLRRQGFISVWHDRRISGGTEWKEQISAHLDSAALILLLVSPDFLASDYCYDIEMKRALERHADGTARVVPVILRPVDWHEAPFGKLQALPKDGRPISTWANRDQAFKDVVEGIRRTIRELRVGEPAPGKAPVFVVKVPHHGSGREPPWLDPNGGPGTPPPLHERLGTGDRAQTKEEVILDMVKSEGENAVRFAIGDLEVALGVRTLRLLVSNNQRFNVARMLVRAGALEELEETSNRRPGSHMLFKPTHTTMWALEYLRASTRRPGNVES